MTSRPMSPTSARPSAATFRFAITRLLSRAGNMARSSRAGKGPHAARSRRDQPSSFRTSARASVLPAPKPAPLAAPATTRSPTRARVRAPLAPGLAGAPLGALHRGPLVVGDDALELPPIEPHAVLVADVDLDVALHADPIHGASADGTGDGGAGHRQDDSAHPSWCATVPA